ncbi:MAG TPA: GAF domain-containing protein [Rhizomicrobium sp.]|jgi:GAF domain-containing protein|nr:GAF domain-containing protein [Rhizomicrobium sp.]
MTGTFVHERTFESRWKLLEAARERLSRANSLDEVMAIVRSTARGVASADGVCFVLRDGDACHYAEEDAIAPLWKGQRFPMSACISGWAMLNAKTAVIEDIFADPRIPHEAYRPTFVKSLIMAPVGAQSPAAAIGAYWAVRRAFSAREVELVESLAAAIARPMQKAAA